VQHLAIKINIVYSSLQLLRCITQQIIVVRYSFCVVAYICIFCMLWVVASTDWES